MDFGDLPGRRNPNGRSAFLPKLNSAPFEATVSIIRHPGIGELLMSINPVLAGIAAVVALVSAQSVCKRNIEMTPLCKIEVTHPRVLGSREVRRGGVVDEQAGVRPS